MKKTSEVHKHKAFLIIKLALLLVLGYAVLRTAMMLRSADDTFVPNSTTVAERKIRVVRKDSIVESGRFPDRSIQDYSAILERDLFGNAASSLGASADKSPEGDNGSDPARLAEEELDIALLGTVAGSPEISRAIIEDIETNILSLYKVGDTVASACIERIEKDAVVLLHQGQRKTVNLGARESKRREADNAEAVLARNAPQAFERDPRDRRHTTVADRLRYAATMLPKAVIKPHDVDGQVEGLRITGLEEIRYLEELGLRNGDVIRAVNGHRLTSKQKAYQISKKARSQANVNIELLRDNRTQTLSFYLG